MGGELSKAVVLLSSGNAHGLALRSGANGSPVFPGLTVQGGTLAGLPAVASEALGDQLIVLDATRLLVADDQGMSVEFSRHASVAMSDVPTQHAGTGTPATVTSMWQTNSIAIRIDRHVSWAYSGPIAIVDGAAYLSEGGSP
jgi:hypothetical protein